MAKVVIKKRVVLDFLGEEYAESYLVFKAMPIKDYEEFIKASNAVEDAESVRFLLNKLKDSFLEGKFLEEELTKEDLEDFDAETIIKAFQAYTGTSTAADPTTGEAPDPKG